MKYENKRSFASTKGRKYFISSSFILSKLLYEVGIIKSVDHCFKNINTFETHNNIYENLRKQIPMNYNSFTSRK